MDIWVSFAAEEGWVPPLDMSAQGKDVLSQDFHAQACYVMSRRPGQQGHAKPCMHHGHIIAAVRPGRGVACTAEEAPRPPAHVTAGSCPAPGKAAAQAAHGDGDHN